MHTEPTSARAMKSAAKSVQSETLEISLFQRLGIGLFNQGWQPQQMQSILDQMCLLLAAEHALIATQESGTLTIAAARGQSFPIGSRIPIMGALAQLLKPPIHFEVHHHMNARLWTTSMDSVSENMLVVIAQQQKPLGIMAFAGNRLHKNAAKNELLQAVCGLIGLALLPRQQVQASAADAQLLELLTPREREVFALLPSGLSNQKLAEKLGIAAGTVKIHVERILNKLNLNDRTQAAVKAVELGYRSR